MTKIFIHLLFFIISICLIFVFTRSIIYFLPGNPIETLLAETGSKFSYQEIQNQYHLNEPFLKKLLIDSRHFLNGDFNQSMLTGESVREIVIERTKNTFFLSTLSLVISFSFSVLLAIYSSGQFYLSKNINLFSKNYAAFSSAIPTPWIGPILIFIFCVLIPIFPIEGNIVLPILTLSFVYSGFWVRILKNRIQENLHADSTRAARSRGLTEFWITLKYGLAPATGSLIAYFGTSAGKLFTGAVVTEVIFNWNGLGTLFVDAVLARDYPIIEAATLIGAIFCILGNILGDIGQNVFQKK